MHWASQFVLLDPLRQPMFACVGGSFRRSFTREVHAFGRLLGQWSSLVGESPKGALHNPDHWEKDDLHPLGAV